MLETTEMFPFEHHGQGVLFVDNTSVARGSFRLQRGRYDDSSPFTLDAFLNAEKGGQLSPLAMLSHELSFVGKTSDGELLEIPKLDSYSLRGGDPAHLHAQVRELMIGVEPLDYDPVRFILRASLTPSDAIAPRFWTATFADDGRIVGDEPTPLQRISTNLGLMVVKESFEFETLTARTIEGDLRIRRNVAELVLERAQLSQEIPALLAMFRKNMDDLCTILSFLARRRVEAFAVSGTFSPGSGQDERFRDRFDWFRTATSPGQRQLSMPLVYNLTIPDNALELLLTNFRSHPLRESIRLAVDYLVTSNQEGHLEARLVSAFTAMESVVNASGEADNTIYTMDAKRFKRLSSSVRKTIRDFFGKNVAGHDQLVMEACSKVSELHRRPIVPRTKEIVEQKNVRWDDLWPASVELGDGLTVAYRLRNGLVHAGQVPDRELAERTHLRVHTLAERLIYTLLDGDVEWLHPYSDSYTRRLREV